PCLAQVSYRKHSCGLILQTTFLPGSRECLAARERLMFVHSRHADQCWKVRRFRSSFFNQRKPALSKATELRRLRFWAGQARVLNLFEVLRGGWVAVERSILVRVVPTTREANWDLLVAQQHLRNPSSKARHMGLITPRPS